MPERIKKSISAAAIIALIGVLYFGTYLPYRKSRVFIQSLQAASQSKSLEELTKSFSRALDFYSPIGQEELVRNMGDSILGIIRNNVNDPEVMRSLIGYLDGYIQPIIEGGHGLSYTQNLYLMGIIYEIAAINTNTALAGPNAGSLTNDQKLAYRKLQENFLQQAEVFFLEGLKLSPTRPQFLYGIFDVYRFTGDFENARLYGNKILKQWPADKRVQKIMEGLPASN